MGFSCDAPSIPYATCTNFRWFCPAGKIPVQVGYRVDDPDMGAPPTVPPTWVMSVIQSYAATVPDGSTANAQYYGWHLRICNVDWAGPNPRPVKKMVLYCVKK